MKRNLLPNVEPLETKALLSHLGGGVAAARHQLAIVKATNARAESQLEIRLTTDQTSYTVGQTVQMSLIATNHTRHNVIIWVGPDANVFSITQNGQIIWRSNSGPGSLRPTVRRVIHPGQSLTLTADWTATEAGTFVVHNQLAPRGPVASFSVTAKEPVTLPVPPVSPPVGTGLDVKLTTNQTTYQIGQVVQMTMTATNDTDHDVTVFVGPNTNVFTIMQDGQIVWQSNSGPQPLNPTVAKVLGPGQSLTLTASWTSNATGTFVVSNDVVPQGPVATFTVMASPPVAVPPVSPPVTSGLAISLTTNQPTYKVGQVVQMTMIATNDSNSDVNVWVGPNTNVFTITQDGQIIWQSNSGLPTLQPTVRQTLKPGQSLTVTASWKATKTGTFVVSNNIVPDSPVATFGVEPGQPTSLA
jgi:uncharacterized protein YpmB